MCHITADSCCSSLGRQDSRSCCVASSEVEHQLVLPNLKAKQILEIEKIWYDYISPQKGAARADRKTIHAPTATIVERKATGYGIVANILALVREVPLGHRRVQVGLQLRQAWFLNGILFNSEIWQKITKKDMSDLCAIDHYL